MIHKIDTSYGHYLCHIKRVTGLDNPTFTILLEKAYTDYTETVLSLRNTQFIMRPDTEGILRVVRPANEPLRKAMNEVEAAIGELLLECYK